jgi:oxygen-independent coproporphyrinogen-3 oxidase
MSTFGKETQRALEGLLETYDKPGPRYTSYPTAPVWDDDFGEADWLKALARADQSADEPFSLYVHLPFCESMCFYCACNVVITQRREKARAYVDRLLFEVERVAKALPHRRKVGQHHWGGGTPTYLPPEEIERLFLGISAHFPLTNQAEVSIEVDPRVTSFEQLAILRKLGFNRISMGIQDFDPKVQEAIHRVQSEEMTYSLIEEARRVGFESVNVDLVYGLPYQHPESFKRTIDTILDWKVDRVACYGFAHVPWVKKHQKALPTAALPSPQVRLNLLTLSLEHFESAGYRHIGFDHFARPSDSLAIASAEGRLHRNFMGYTTRMGKGRAGEDMLMFGMTSIGEVGGAFGQNEKDLKSWTQAIDENRLPIHRGMHRSPDDEERRRIILDLMCNYELLFKDYEGEGKKPFSTRYEKALKDLRRMEKDQLVQVHEDRIQVPPLGRLFLRNLSMPFDAYLEEQRKSKGPMFSRTI